MQKHDPWSLLGSDMPATLNRLRSQFNQMFDQDLALFDGENTNIATSTWTPSVDIREEDDKYVFTADIPGVDPKQIEVTAENGMLTIKGERESEKKEEKKGYKRIERSWGSFYRRFSLPDNVDTGKIDARSKDGVLELSIPKTASAKPRKIDIKS